MAADQSYYDAVSLHKYLSGNLLDASAELQGAVDYIKSVYPGKPIWLTEWAVNGSGDNALGALSTAEIYLYLFNRMDEITMNQNFQVFGGGNFYDQSFNKTSFGASYDIIRSVFADSEMFANTSTSTAIASGIQAVLAEAVVKDGELIVFALNKADKAATFTLKFDGLQYSAPVKHEALAFNDANEFKLFGFTENPLSTLSQATTTIILPPLSMNVISGISTLPAVTSSIEIEAESAAGQANLPPFVVESDLGGPTYIVVPNGTGSANFDQVTSNQGIAS